MKQDKSINIIFKNSKKEVDINLSSLINCTIEFLEIYQDSSFAAADFWEITKGKDGETQFLNLLKATGYESNPEKFFMEILINGPDNGAEFPSNLSNNTPFPI